MFSVETPGVSFGGHAPCIEFEDAADDPRFFRVDHTTRAHDLTRGMKPGLPYLRGARVTVDSSLIASKVLIETLLTEGSFLSSATSGPLRNAWSKAPSWNK